MLIVNAKVEDNNKILKIDIDAYTSKIAASYTLCKILYITQNKIMSLVHRLR